jgi:hypothetical protein
MVIGIDKLNIHCLQLLPPQEISLKFCKYTSSWHSCSVWKNLSQNLHFGFIIYLYLCGHFSENITVFPFLEFKADPKFEAHNSRKECF